MCYSLLVENDLKWLARNFNANVDTKAFDSFARLHAVDPKKFRDLASHSRIYPNYWAPILVCEQNQLWIRPMRYRLLPSWSPQEIATKYNLFNARVDMLQERRSWRQLVGRRHGMIVFKAFFEWVENSTGKKVVIKFFPADHRLIVAPVLWDVWHKEDHPGAASQKLAFDALTSFAVITGDPHPDVLAAGHDRTPIFLRPQNYEPWLKPVDTSQNQLKSLLEPLDGIHYAHEIATP